MHSRSKVKLVFINPSLKSGGGNRVFIELSTLLTERFKRIAILYPNNSNDKSHYHISDDVELLPVGKVSSNIVKKVLNVFLCIKEIRKLLDRDPDVISIISDPILCIFYMVLPKRYKERTYRFIQADDYRIFDDRYILKSKFVLMIFKKLCLKSYYDLDNLLFNSVYTYNQFKDLLPKSNLPMKLVQPGINVTTFYDKKIRVEDQLNICLVARKHPWKGFVDFLKAWESLDEQIRGKVENIFVISHDDLGDFELPIRTKIIKPNSDLEISEVMNLSHIFISTSWWEGFGLPPLEAMACGCAVISSNSKGILEYAKDGRNCIIYEPKNIDQLSDSISKLILDKSLQEWLTGNGINDAKHFTWQNTANQFSKNITLHNNPA